MIKYIIDNCDAPGVLIKEKQMDSSGRILPIVEDDMGEMMHDPHEPELEDHKLSKRRCKRCHNPVPKCSCSLGPKLRGR
jgi:hypothetical protein